MQPLLATFNDAAGVEHEQEHFDNIDFNDDVTSVVLPPAIENVDE